MKRFYDAAAIEASGDGHAVTLDGKTAKTPARRDLVLPHELLATAIATEWANQGESIEPESMPIMRLAATAIDRVADNRAAVVNEVAAYGETDLLCYRVAEPEDLVARQSKEWQPLLDWCAERFGAELATTQGALAIDQDSDALAALRAEVEDYDDFSLAALHSITTATGSLVIALALSEGHIDGRTAWMTCRVDEMHQAERWGMDEESRGKIETLRLTLGASARFLRMCNRGRVAPKRVEL